MSMAGLRQDEKAMTIQRIHYIRGKPLPPGAKCVNRISRWGNRYKLLEHGGQYTREEAVARYRTDLEAMTPQELQEYLEPLRGATALACARLACSVMPMC